MDLLGRLGYSEYPNRPSNKLTKEKYLMVKLLSNGLDEVSA